MRSQRSYPIPESGELNMREIEAKEAFNKVQWLIDFIGDDPDREGLKDTPQRVIRSFNELYGGYQVDVPSLFTTFSECENYDQMVTLKDIEFFSTCEHHMLPFFGKAHIAYLPDKKVIGVSKLARILDAFAARLQIQERIGQQVTDAIMKHLEPLGVACVIEAQHFCMKARGVKKLNSIMVTSSLTGCFKDEPSTRSEFMQFIK